VFLPIIRAEATDDRNYVKKAVNWALRQIGKRSPELNRKAIATAKQIQKLDARSARWIASDALRELESAAVQDRLREPARI
jgi:3-methyladenine DNA glycosylase AlkD